ncbi:hypothetical protein [Streptomyces sp. CS014]|uniref:hypothetical protein n=1 Tax=Streptomyces sp. CS014 TaxID=2162707 RepID=UPI0013A58918|nr:hypothetical protein [Streptomyces sp. CS014]
MSNTQLAAQLAAFMKTHCANCGKPEADRTYHARLIGPLTVCRPCHITETAVELDLLIGTSERLDKETQLAARTAARRFVEACNDKPGMTTASLGEAIKTARTYAGQAQKLGHEWTIRNAMGTARKVIVKAEDNRQLDEAARLAAKKAAARDLVKAAHRHMLHAAAHTPETAAAPNTPATVAQPASGAHTPATPPATGKPKGKGKGKKAQQVEEQKAESTPAVTAGVDLTPEQRGKQLMEQAVRIIQARQGHKLPGGDWQIEKPLMMTDTVQHPVYFGRHANARIKPDAYGKSYLCTVFSKNSKPAWTATYRSLDLALTATAAQADHPTPGAATLPAAPGPKPRITLRQAGAHGMWNAHVNGRKYVVALETGGYSGGRWAVVAPDNTRVGVFNLDHETTKEQPPARLVKDSIITHLEQPGGKYNLRLTQTSTYHWSVDVHGEERYAIRHDNRGRNQVGIDWSLQYITGEGKDIKVSTLVEESHMGLVRACELINQHLADGLGHHNIHPDSIFAGPDTTPSEEQPVKVKKAKSKKTKKGAQGKA